VVLRLPASESRWHLPERKGSRPHIFKGWWSVLFIGIISGLGHGFNSYGISVFFKRIASELSLSREATSWAPGIGRLEGGITSPLAGWLSDRFGPRWVVITGILITGTGMILMNFVTREWQYYVAWGVFIGFGLNIGLTVACDKMINDWFLRRRGLAQGIKFGLISVIGIALIQIITPLVDVKGWRFTCLIWGIMVLAAIPLAYLLIKPRRPEYYGLLPDGAEVSLAVESSDMMERGAGYASSFQEMEYTFKQTLKTSTYWLLLIGFCVHNIIASGMNIHVYPFLTDNGISEEVAASMLGMMIFFTAPARLFGGIIADRIPKQRLPLILLTAFLLHIVGLSNYLGFQSLPSIYLLLACHGLASGVVTPVIVLILGRYYGRKAFGSILGTMVAFLSPLGLLAPVFYGRVFDITQSYNVAFQTALGLAVVAAVTMFFVRVPRPPALPRPQW
jgi:MFS family permease